MTMPPPHIEELPPHCAEPVRGLRTCHRCGGAVDVGEATPVGVVEADAVDGTRCYACPACLRPAERAEAGR